MSEEIDHDAYTQVKTLMGDQFSKLVDTYLTSNRAHVVKIKQGYESGNVEMIVDSAHPMKSAAGNMGLKALSEIAQELETAAKNVLDGQNQLESLESMVSEIEAHFQKGESFLTNN